MNTGCMKKHDLLPHKYQSDAALTSYDKIFNMNMCEFAKIKTLKLPNLWSCGFGDYLTSGKKDISN